MMPDTLLPTWRSSTGRHGTSVQAQPIAAAFSGGLHVLDQFVEVHALRVAVGDRLAEFGGVPFGRAEQILQGFVDEVGE